MFLQNPNHPTIPDEYKNKTNYKNIPKEYLERKIPKGRGMIKWQPFASTPDLYSDIDNQISSQTFKQMPHLSEEQIDNLNIKIHEGYLLQKVCMIKYYKNHDYHIIKCFIKKIYVNEKFMKVYLTDYKKDGTLLFKNIIDVMIE